MSSCATCDGFFFRGQHIIVVGGGDAERYIASITQPAVGEATTAAMEQVPA